MVPFRAISQGIVGDLGCVQSGMCNKKPTGEVGFLFSGSNRFNTRLNPRCFNDRRAAEVVHPSSVTKAEEKAKPKYAAEGTNRVVSYRGG